MPAATLPLVTVQDSPAGAKPCDACPLKRELYELRARAGFLDYCFRKSQEREQALRQENARCKAEIRALRQRLYGKKSEAQTSTVAQTSSATTTVAAPPSPDEDAQPKKRGRRQGMPGHPRRSHSHLPVEPEVADLPADQRLCPCCGSPYAVMDKTDDGDILEIDVRAYRRRYQRKRYRPPASAPGVPRSCRRRHRPK
jgi:hypothetical protein